MKGKSLLTLAVAGVLTLGVSVFAFASEPVSNALNGCFRQNGTTGVKSLMDQGKSFEEAKAEMLEVKYDRVDASVESGNITAERGQEIKDEMTANSRNCTTPAENRDNCEGYELSGGNGTGECDGTGVGKGNGMGRGQGKGMRRGNGSCGVNK